MAEKLTWEEIKQRYDGEWVELIDFEWDETQPDPQAGIVRFHARDAKEFHRLIKENPIVDAALVYVGDLFPNRENVIFSANLHQYASRNK